MTTTRTPDSADRGDGDDVGAAAYWEEAWASGRGYRRLHPAEIALMDAHLGPGRGRPALDLGCGDGELAWHLHHLGYRVTAVDHSPTALARAAARSTHHDNRPAGAPTWTLADVTACTPARLPEPAYALVTCRLVYRFVTDKPGLLSCVRRLLAPGGTFWVVTELAERATGPLTGLGITPVEAELLTAGWSHVTAHDLDRLRCYALHP